MAKLEIKCDFRKLEKELNKKVNQIVERKQKELNILQKKENLSMVVLSQNAEEMLRVFIEEYEKTDNYSVNGNVCVFPEHIQLAINDLMEELKMCGYISKYNHWIAGGYFVTLTPEGVQYFEKKGDRVELFSELVNGEKTVLKEIIEIEEKDENITDFIVRKLENDPKDIYRGILGVLRKNGLLDLIWADNTVYYAKLTQAGRSFFEREVIYNEEREKSKIVNNNNFNGSTVFMGNVISSNINVNNSFSQIEKSIDEKCTNEDEKEELKQILEEVKEIIENIKESKHIEKRNGFFTRLTNHCDKHGWFYAQIISLFGKVVLDLMKNSQ